ncbi:hypothetical protein D3C85_915120 [compost metagenome]
MSGRQALAQYRLRVVVVDKSVPTKYQMVFTYSGTKTALFNFVLVAKKYRWLTSDKTVA